MKEYLHDKAWFQLGDIMRNKFLRFSFFQLLLIIGLRNVENRITLEISFFEYGWNFRHIYVEFV